MYARQVLCYRLRTEVIGARSTRGSVSRLAVASALAALVGCVGTLEGPAASSSRSRRPITEPNEPPTVDACAVRAPDVGRSELAMLTRRQLANAFLDVLGTSVRVSDHVSSDQVVQERVVYDHARLGASELDAYASLAEAVAREVAFPLPGTECAADGCIRDAFATVGRRLFRRPLFPDELDRLAALHELGRTELELDAGGAARLVLSAMLQSPSFLVLGEEAISSSADEIVPLDGTEMATRLAAFLWQSTPSPELLAAAAELETIEGVERHATAMLADARADRAMIDLHMQWLGLRRGGATSDTDADGQRLLHAGDDALARSLANEAFATFVHLSRDGTFADLFSSRTGYPDARSAEIVYGLEGVSGTGDYDELAPHELPASERAGVLTLPFFLSAWNAPYDPSRPREGYRPVIIGARMREHLLCLQNGSPPPGALEMNEGLRGDDAWSVSLARQATSCGACHRGMDPLGFLFARYDHLGRFRSDEELREQVGIPIGEEIVIDLASGSNAPSPDATLDGPTSGLVELSARLAESDVARSCYVGHWTLYAFGRPLDEADACSRVYIEDRFARSGYRIRELLLAIVTSDAFRHRRAATPGVCE